jgi:hypothetical protein
MTWVKGQSGCPAGKAKGVKDKRKQLRDLLWHLVPKAAQVLEEMLSEKDNKAFAAKEVFDRVYGKAAQAVELTGKAGGPMQAVIQLGKPPTE